MTKTGLIGLLLIVFYTACSQDTIVSKVVIGSSYVNIKTSCAEPCKESIAFINVHENENTSVEAAKTLLQEIGGKLTRLSHTGQRNISFKVDKKPYSFDPNRMFTPTGRKETLSNVSAYTPKAAKEIQPLADELLRKYVDGKKLVIALHNNTDSAFSILSYTVSEQEGNNADLVFINEAMDTDDFVLTTDSTIFKQIQEKDINVVLQSRNVKDDGSLSVYAYYKNIPYINVEAQHGHLEEQTRMLKALKEIIILYADN